MTQHKTLEDLQAADLAAGYTVDVVQRRPNVTRLRDLPADVLEAIAHLLKSEKNPAGADADELLPRPTGYHVLALQFIRPEKVGSIILAEVSRKEDAYQGRIGIVLAVGPDAYTDAKFSAPWCQPGDWIAWPALENASGRYPFDGATLVGLTDDRVILTGCNPRRMVGR